MLTEACSKATNAPLTWGHRECFSRPIDELRETGTRLIVVILAEKYDSWTAEAYATLHADPIIARFESMNTEGQESTDITVLQCQVSIPESMYSRFWPCERAPSRCPLEENISDTLSQPSYVLLGTSTWLSRDHNRDLIMLSSAKILELYSLLTVENRPHHSRSRKLLCTL